MKKLILIAAPVLLFGCCKEQDARCSMIPEPGLCNAAIPRYYFDQNENRCKEFIWGGCGGVVPFETMAECEACDCH